METKKENLLSPSPVGRPDTQAIFLPKVCLLPPSVPKISDTLDNSNTFPISEARGYRLPRKLY